MYLFQQGKLEISRYGVNLSKFNFMKKSLLQMHMHWLLKSYLVKLTKVECLMYIFMKQHLNCWFRFDWTLFCAGPVDTSALVMYRHIDGLVQERCNAIASHLSYTNPLIYCTCWVCPTWCHWPLFSPIIHPDLSCSCQKTSEQFISLMG